MPESSRTLEDLIALFSRIPGLGPRSARRAVLALLKKKEILMQPLIQTMSDVVKTVMVCPECGNLDTASPCSICKNSKRSGDIVCVVADLADLWAIERANVYKGHYLVLGGLLSAFEGITPEDLFLKPLLDKDREKKIREVIFALPATLEGQTTQHYIMQRLSPNIGKISVLARGLPSGAELDYLDDGTLESAFESRIILSNNNIY